MIFTRVLVSVVAVAGIVACLGRGGPDPGIELAARRLVVDRAEAADAALGALASALEGSLELARKGATRTAAGPEPPGPALTDAGEALLAAEPLADEARDAIAALDRARRAAAPATAPVGTPIEDGEAAALGAEITALAPAADGFADLRLRAEGLTTLLADALDAIAEDDPETAAALVAAARADHDLLRSWDSGLDALPVWLDMTADLLAATEALVDAVADGDRPAAVAASDAIAALGPEATTADRALRIALSEGAGAVLAGPPVRVAELVQRVNEARSEVAAILHAVGR